MDIASRTPEGDFNRCPVCLNGLVIDPSRPPGDAPCPHCGTLVWFGPKKVEAIHVNVTELMSKGEFGNRRVSCHLCDLAAREASDGWVHIQIKGEAVFLRRFGSQVRVPIAQDQMTINGIRAAVAANTPWPES
jgi:hypothetical protein